MSRDADTTAAAPPEDVETYAELYRRMLLIRGFEDRVQSLFLRGEIYGTTHLYSGQEAVAVGFASSLGPDDRVACTYRGHGHLLAMGTDPEGLLAELLGRETGVNGGRAGSMNVVDPEHGVLGCYGIVGGSIAAATGAGLSLRGTGAVAVAYFGDGTTNQAYFFECLNFAKVFELPTTELDGMDVRAVRTAAREIVERVRAGGGPEFVEARTYRFVGHSRSDPGKYRPDGELDRWRERDPLLVAGSLLRDELGMSAESVAQVGDEVDAELDRIEAAALAAPFPGEITLPEFSEGA